MKVAILSDVHGNFLALEAVIDDVLRQGPDLVFHGGDLVLSGPRPADVVDRLQELGWPGVVGNTDEVLWAGAHNVPFPVRPQFEILRQATLELLGPARITWLRQLPYTWRHEQLLLLHASPGDLWAAPAAAATDTELVATYGHQNADLVIYGHIHHPFVRQLGKLTVANSGSVGWPVDGDWRPSYLLIEDGRVSVRHVQYDVERDIAELAASTYPLRSWLIQVHREAKFILPMALDPH